ncbi:MAG TPA: hypothetical protein VJW23_08275 [Propionibacteriaceae bacterium]|nr:hypothetical protein [Propionibacteriaceae bacterium]
MHRVGSWCTRELGAQTHLPSALAEIVMKEELTREVLGQPPLIDLCTVCLITLKAEAKAESA